MPVLARAFFLLALTVLAVGGIVVGIAVRRVGRSYDLPPPPIARATAPEEIARGGRLFRTNCLDCHAGRADWAGSADGARTTDVAPSADVAGPADVAGTSGGSDAPERRPIGALVTGAPEFLGEIWAPNLTSDPRAGIGGWTDAELARLLRNGIGRDGRYAGAMPRFARLSDQDVAALVGFLRSSDPLVAPSSHQVPRPGLGLAGTLALAFAAGVDTRGDAHVPMPARGPTADYGRYLATTVYGCVDCHTDGFKTTDENLLSPVLLAGGLFLRTPRGDPIYSTNLTPEPETGVAAWTAADLARTLTTGIGRSGLPLRSPMPVFRFVDADEATALFAYLRSVPPVYRRTPGAPRARAAPDAPAASLFATLCCAMCHAEGAARRAFEKHAAEMPVAEIAALIRNPETRHPGTQMPTYAAVVDEATALRLGEWIRSSGDHLAR